jgi:transcription antitermination factor NusG
LANLNDYFWYAVYTNPRAEKKTALLLSQRGIEVYLPLQKKLQQWSDRKKWVELPLFSSYLFVRISEREYLDVLNTPGVVRYITFSGKAAKIYDHEIETIRLLLSTGEDLEVQSYQLQKGQTVKVIAGNFMGLQGRIAGTQNNKRFIVDFQQLGQSIMLNIPSTYLEPVF